MQHVVANPNGKIWAFIAGIMEYEVIREEEQMLTIKLHNINLGLEVLISLVYAKCTQGERLQLWESMYDLATTTNIPWLIGEDFNVISNSEEKLRGQQVIESEVRDFNHCISVCNLEDKVLEIEHLVRSGWDHTPLSITFKTSAEKVIKPFRFLIFWVKENSFMEVIRNHWKADFERDPFILFHHKLKRVKRALTQWSKETFGNIFQEIVTLKEIIKIHEIEFEVNPTGGNREKLQKTQADLKK
ncbi:hypothetical protein H5410_032514 [Solanum commersonii]|uniref:Endonuclease/exonuclease/phosphatase domain-containing protein n=1 Tax=Solanum commersonii TaxID=4109 RepID=A0A9J5YN47_SOLCO|nr:hypothetical protein H5410_032514 [Solanum commersonii]